MRKFLFLLHIIIGQWPVWGLIWLFGQLHVWHVLFVIYPVDPKEYVNMAPNNKWLKRYMSGRPIPAGLIWHNKRPIGIYFYISNGMRSLRKKQNKYIAKLIEQRMYRWMQISGAKVCGFAGQLGIVMEKRHNIAMSPPFYISTLGNICSIISAIKTYDTTLNTKIGILGGGELAAILADNIASAEIINVKYRRRTRFIIANKEKAATLISDIKILVNLLPTGEDFINIGIADLIASDCTIIDFSRPPISIKNKNKIIMGNRLSRPGTRFYPALPNWQNSEIPACSLPCLLAAEGDLSVAMNVQDFNIIASYMGFNSSQGR